METRNKSYVEAAKTTPEEVQARKKAAEERKRVREATVEQPQDTAQEKPEEENVDKTVDTVGDTVVVALYDPIRPQPAVHRSRDLLFIFRSYQNEIPFSIYHIKFSYFASELHYPFFCYCYCCCPVFTRSS